MLNRVLSFQLLNLIIGQAQSTSAALINLNNTNVDRKQVLNIFTNGLVISILNILDSCGHTGQQTSSHIPQG